MKTVEECAYCIAMFYRFLDNYVPDEAVENAVEIFCDARKLLELRGIPMAFFPYILKIAMNNPMLWSVVEGICGSPMTINSELGR